MSDLRSEVRAQAREAATAVQETHGAGAPLHPGALAIADQLTAHLLDWQRADVSPVDASMITVHVIATGAQRMHQLAGMEIGAAMFLVFDVFARVLAGAVLEEPVR